MTNLFEAAGLEKGAPRPLADRLRPKRLAEVVGQDHLVGPDGTLTRMLRSGRLQSMILWGPPGSGKTTVARLLARRDQARLRAAVGDLLGRAGPAQGLRPRQEPAPDRHAARCCSSTRSIASTARSRTASCRYMEDGTITLVGATTENPSFELNGALLSRALVLVFHRLDEAALEKLLQRAEQEEGRALPLDAEAREALKAMADGDGRTRSTWPRRCSARAPRGSAAADRERSPAWCSGARRSTTRSRDGHYNLISALHKSVRGSDPDASLYWLARMLDGGEDRLFIARRLVRMAIEDIGLADPQALVQALAAKDVYDFLGTPEGELALAQATVYLATAPKSNAAYMAYDASMRAAKEHGSLAPPKHILNAPTQADGRGGLRPRLRLRPQRAGRVLRARTISPTRWSASSSTRRRARLRGRAQEAARALGQAAQGAQR